jgi:hypothetical protein
MIDGKAVADAIIQVETLKEREPEVTQLQSILVQLRYLADYVAGRNRGERLGEINIGLLAVREVEPRSEAVAELLHTISGQVRAVRGETGWPK